MIRAKNQPRVSCGAFISLGAVGRVHKIDDRIVLKSSRKAGCEKFAHEVTIYDILESCHPSCPDISRSFLRVPDGNFLAFYGGGTLDQRLQRHQVRNQEPYGGRLIGIKVKEPLHLVEQWIMELSNAAAWLESHSYVHTDIRPPNLLLDIHDHLKLTDFDCMEEIGTRALGGAPPWARLCGSEAGSETGSFGYNGARVEQFAIGSVLYLMTHGHEPYDDGNFGPQDGPAIVQLLKLMEFPPLGGENLDEIVRKCWKARYVLLKDLADETKLLPGANNAPRAVPFQDEYVEKVREDCQQLIENGLLDRIN